MMQSLGGFLKYNRRKKMTLAIYAYTCLYRMLILCIPSKYLKKHWGEEGSESKPEESIENYKYARTVSINVNKVASKTQWESKCLVRALTARKLLIRKGISCTLYLGVGKDEEKMVAHAWLRCGEMYVTGGDGTGYAIVATYAS